MKSKISRFLTTLVALFAMTTGAWAQTGVMPGAMFPPESTAYDLNTWKWAQNWTTVTTDHADFVVKGGTFSLDDFTPTTELILIGLKYWGLAVCGVEGKVSTVQLLNASGEVVKTETYNKALTFDESTRIKISTEFFADVAENYTIRVNLGEYSLAMEKTKDKNEWTLDAMPAGNVELQVAYYPGMLTLPAKTAQGSIEVVGLGGATLPAGFDTDGTNYYVEPKTQFQVKAVPAEGYHLVSLSDGTNTYDVDADGIATVTMPEGDADLTLTATFSDEFELTFDDVNFKTNQNITVKVGDADKTLDQDGKLSVKSGQTVTLTAKQGYKFRSVEAKKAAKAPTTAQLNVPTGWNGDNTKVSANDLPGFVALTDEEAQAIPCPDAEGYVYVIHSVPSDGYIKIIAFNNGEKQAQQSFTLARNHGEIYDDVNDIQIKYYYTTGK